MATSAVLSVDLTELPDKKPQISAELTSAAIDVGFFYVTGKHCSAAFNAGPEAVYIVANTLSQGGTVTVGHGIAQADINAAFDQSIRYLNLPQKIRSQHVKDKSNAAYIMGWSERCVSAGQLTHGLLMCYDNAKMEGLWPSEEECPGFKETMLTFMHKLHKVAADIMTCIAMGLGLPEDFFVKEMDPDASDCMTAMSCNHYPSWEGKAYQEGTLRRIAHTDFEILTLLFQRTGEPGLEVCAGHGTTPQQAMQSGLWVPCDPVDGAITVNIGDALQYWSDGRLKSTYHRVRMPRPDEYQGDRYSIAYFANTRATTKLQGPAKKYPPITFPDILAAKGKHRKTFAKSTDSDMTDEEYIAFQKGTAIGPDFDDPATAAAVCTNA